MNSSPLVLSLQRLFGFPLPIAVFNNRWARVATSKTMPGQLCRKSLVVPRSGCPAASGERRNVRLEKDCGWAWRRSSWRATMNPCFTIPTSTSLACGCVRHSYCELKGGFLRVRWRSNDTAVNG